VVARRARIVVEHTQEEDESAHQDSRDEATDEIA
jgi:hypothetical protein